MNLLQQLEAEHIKALGKDIPDFAPGDTVRVGYKVTEGTRTRVQNYEGVCIARRKACRQEHRRLALRCGRSRLARASSVCSRSTRRTSTTITVVRRGKVRRAKLYYLRSRRGKSARIAEKTNYRAPKPKGGETGAEA